MAGDAALYQNCWAVTLVGVDFVCSCKPTAGPFDTGVAVVVADGGVLALVCCCCASEYADGATDIMTVV